ncbi:hypothetical protein [Glycomyces sp. NPDC021274]|uniref:hypothetical protein n=1 Tax=Glycomyces sp. NPDC021274 TaxID=3155120 RepID=UPI0033E17A32
MDEEERSGYVFRGNVQTGAVGTGASATVGAIGEGSRGYVFAGASDADRELRAELLRLVGDLRAALREQRESVGEEYAVIEDTIDDLEESVVEAKPPRRLHSKAKAIERLVSPFAALAEQVSKLLELLQRHQS